MTKPTVVIPKESTDRSHDCSDPTDPTDPTDQSEQISATLPTYTMSEIAANTDETTTWLKIGNSVFDVTPYIASGEHPGGDEILRDAAGTDATSMFEDIGHSTTARSILTKYRIGTADSVECKKHKIESTTDMITLICIGCVAGAAVMVYKYY